MPSAFPTFNADFEIKSQLIHLLPKFHGLTGENPYLLLQTLYMQCLSMKTIGVSIDDVMWKVFYLSLEGKAKEWYMNIPLYVDNSYESWTSLKKAFLDKYFPSTKILAAHKEILAAKQEPFETFFEFWSRFQEMLSQCTNHQILKEHLVQYFYNGLSTYDAQVLDAVANRFMENMEPRATWELIRTFALNRQHVSARDLRDPKSERDPLLVKLAQDMSKVANTVESLHSNKTQSLALVATSCEFCSSPMHTIANCPGPVEEVNAMYQGREGSISEKGPLLKHPQPQLRDHPNIKWGGGANRPN
ncbi:uncharacterized protein LOC114725208 [Neltuma alba]|uniref:uncharacterized protein LOC114725208 n=1 Tax=Neltuma alba TaxID=207710 RepID=UPI0010A3DBE3|nr:uncharacterized protein LOC114725208 [Prosopis alba]